MTPLFVCAYCNGLESPELGDLRVTLGEWLHFPYHTYLRLRARREAGENIPLPIWEQALADARDEEKLPFDVRRKRRKPVG